MSAKLRKRLLFVCVGNSSRSQMAEAFARMHGGDLVEAYSAGIRPSGRLDDKAIEAMRKRGYDLGAHRSKGLADVPGEFDVVVTMGCEESCPNVPAKRRIAWELPHPKDVRPEDFGTIRDRIDENLRTCLSNT